MTSELLIGKCASCSKPMTGCPQCVNTVRIDPETGLPPDVAVGPNGEAIPVEPTPEAIARSAQEMLCDECISYRNSRYPKEQHVETEASRHERHQFNDSDWSY